MRHRTKHNLGDDWGVSLKDMKVLDSFAYPELYPTLSIRNTWKINGLWKELEI